MTVYADVLFLVNLSLNWFSILLTSKIMKLKTSVFKILLAASLGSVFGIMTLFFRSTVAVTLSEIASAFLMSAVAFKVTGILHYAKICSCLFASGITIGGSLTLLYSFFNRTGIKLQKQNDMSTAVFLILSFCVTVAAMVFERTVTGEKNSSTGKVFIEYDKKTVELDYLCDSGNLLCDPLSGKPAIIVPAKNLEGLIPQKMISFDLQNTDLLSADGLNRIRILPASTICGSSMMTGFVPDNIIVKTPKGTKTVDAVIAIDKKSDTYTNFGALMPISLV